jgi:hypothetical protein
MIAALVVFTAAALADIAWARYVGLVAERKRWLASLWAGALFAIGSVPVMGYTEHRWLIIPAVCGAVVGTALGIK